MTEYEVISQETTIACLGGIEADDCSADTMPETARELVAQARHA